MNWRRDINDRMISMPGILMILFGGCFHFSYNKFYKLQLAISPSAASSLKTFSTFLILFGLWLVLCNYFRLPRLPRFRKKKRIKRTVSFPRQGLVYLAILQVMVLGALLGRANLLLLIFSLMAGVFVVNGGSIYWMLQRLQLKRTLPDSVSAGQVFSVQVALTNHKKIISSRMMEVIDTLSDDKQSYKAETVFAYVSPGSTEYGSYQLKLSKRGKYHFGSMKISSRFPLGIVERGVVTDHPDELLVFPRIGRLSLSWKNMMRADQEVLQSGNLKHRVHEDEFHRIREYRDGDNPRAIHWTSTAKQGEIMVKEFHENRESNLDIILDLWQSDKKAEIQELRIELAISFIATVIYEKFNDSSDLHLNIAVLGKKNFYWEGHPSPQNLKIIMSFLAEAEGYHSNQDETLAMDNNYNFPFNDRVLMVTTRKRGTSAWDQISDYLKNIWSPQRNPQMITMEADPEKMQKYFSLPTL
jgi:Protein of unknown function DUF58